MRDNITLLIMLDRMLELYEKEHGKLGRNEMRRAQVAERLWRGTLPTRRRVVVAKRGVLTRSLPELVGLPETRRCT